MLAGVHVTQQRQCSQEVKVIQQSQFSQGFKSSHTAVPMLAGVQVTQQSQ